MKCSLNELQGLLRRSFEALFAHRLDFEQCAEDIAWLQARDFRSVQALCQSLSLLEQIAATDDLPALSWSDASTVDASQSSLLIAAPYLVDHAIAEAQAQGEFCLNVRLADKPFVLIAGLRRIAEHKLTASLQWQLANSTELHEAVLEAESSQPSYRRIQVANTLAAGSLRLRVSGMSEPRQKATRGFDTILEDKSAQELQALYMRSIRTGIEVPDPCYEILSAVANRLLVEASEQSRRGAGA